MKILKNIILISCFLIGSLNNPASAGTSPAWGDSKVDITAEAQGSSEGHGGRGEGCEDQEHDAEPC